jgi:undecaprenyl-diphosphatase
MKRWHIAPTETDLAVGRFFARHADLPLERTANAASYGGDEHLVLILAAGLWCVSFGVREPQRRRLRHICAAAALAVAASHIVKRGFRQQRPDRLLIRTRRRRGIPYSGRTFDAVPSGHGVQAGALASAAAHVWPATARLAWAAALAVGTARVTLLAHWLTGVLAGMAIGFGLEQILWRADTPCARTTGPAARVRGRCP